MEAIIIPSVLFLTIVAPIWLVLHYRFKSKMAKGISEAEVSDIEDMLEKLDKIDDRLHTLEGILNEEHPGWQKSRRSRS